ncbi:hypothetical protein CH352_05140 [Leptospira hartskeerlii]|uniref:Uncharacterized protein n=2 Tax=Leptospira hartskeerlii TaxID=2023177 RepID=A0A2M9XFY1_9LEPT|nr:hypothetical protein CH357_03315 [Leptospira hartskeerlii]PJZ34979.1 hypothetical protein CH352_05140 [Leptospira hartskeerlii]
MNFSFRIFPFLFLFVMLFATCKKEEPKREDGLKQEDSFESLEDLTNQEVKDFVGTYNVHGFDDDFIKVFAPGSGLKWHSIYQCGKMESNGKIFRIRITNNDKDLVFDVKRKDQYTFVFKINGKTLDVKHYGPGSLDKIIWTDLSGREWKSSAGRIKDDVDYYEECIENYLGVWKSGG